MICSKNRLIAPANELVWSPDRIMELSRCPRRYYYLFIGSWGGWSPSASETAQHLYHLRHLTHIRHQTIRIIRSVVSKILLRATTETTYPIGEAVKYAVNVFNAFIDRSAHLPAEQVTQTHNKLLVDFLGKPLSLQTVADWRRYVADLVRAFYSLEDTNMLLRSPSRLIPESLRLDQFEIGNELGVPARLPIEATWVEKRSLIVGIWSMGTYMPSHTKRALTSDIYIRPRYLLHQGYEVQHRVYFLETGECKIFEFSEEQRENRRKRIFEEYLSLQSHSDDREINTASIARFPAIVSYYCSQCQFQTICDAFRSRTYRQEETTDDIL